MIKDKVRALVTGGTRGIGLAIASKFIENGIDVTVTGKLESGFGPPGSSFYQVDFMDNSGAEIFFTKVEDEGFDILVNNAGINKVSPFFETNIHDFDRIHSINVRAPFRLCQAVLPHMKLQKWGRIVNIGSIFGVISKANRGAYSASKFALDGITAALAAEVAEFNVLVNGVAPGFIKTEMTKISLGDAGIENIALEIPMRRLGEPPEVAALVAWLCSSENTYISGQNIVIDGGLTRV